jgi:hypothetical protein
MRIVMMRTLLALALVLVEACAPSPGGGPAPLAETPRPLPCSRETAPSIALPDVPMTTVALRSNPFDVALSESTAFVSLASGELALI